MGARRRRVVVTAPVSSGGLYSHLRNVMPRLVALRSDWTFEVHSPEEVLRDLFARTDERWMRPRKIGGRGDRLRWEFVELPRALRQDPDALLFAPFGPLWNPFVVPRAVVRLENLIVLLPPRERVVVESDAVRLRILRHVYLSNARRALTPVCASIHSRDRYVELTGLPAERFAVIPHGVDHAKAKRAVMSDALASRLPRRPFVATVGQATPYRKTRELILAYRMLANRVGDALPPLVWAGSARREDLGYERECLHLLEPLRMRGLAIHLPQVAQEDVFALDRACLLFVHPSVHEDCPNTIFEAMAAGAAVVCADIPANREFARDAPQYLSDSTPSAIAEGIERLLSAEPARLGMAERSLERASHLGWDATARAVAEVLERAFRSRSPSRRSAGCSGPQSCS